VTSPISREPIREKVREILVDRLLDRQLEPGQHINESELAAEFGISRTPLREALLQLASEGLIESEPGRGFRVTEMDVRTGRELYSLVAELEVLALKRTGPLDEETVERLRELDRQRARRPEDHDATEAVALDIQWHRALVEACPNQQLLELLDLLRQRVYRYEYGHARKFEQIGVKGLKQHASILEALEAGDTEEAAGRLLDHWKYAVRSLDDWLDEAIGAEGAPEGSD